MSRVQKGRGHMRARKPGTSTDVTHMFLTGSPQAGKASPIKTRRLHKSKQLSISRCTICKTSKGELTPCTRCQKQYHLSKCILFPPSMAARAKDTNWLCPKCIRCSACELMIDDPTNVECANCLQAWHGACKPANSVERDRQWYCDRCSTAFSPHCNAKRNSIQKSRRRSKTLLHNASSPASPSGSSNVIDSAGGTPRRRGRPPKVIKNLGHVAVTDVPLPCTSTSQDVSSVLGATENSDHMDMKETEDILEERSSPKRNQKESTASSQRSPQRKPVPIEIPESISSLKGAQLFDMALKNMCKMELDRKLHSAKDSTQWVNLGGEADIKVLYESPYPEDIKGMPLFFICAYCLKPFSNKSSFFVHQDCCPRIAPPGREIYRDSSSRLSFFEVDGSEERSYCRNLCLLAMLFISSKTSHNEVATFLFYILTKNDANGCRIVGYFSKEKNPSRNNNLSCLLTIPSDQRNGYGHLLIDMSYKLSAIERKVGSPEHPLSDLGLLTYRKYWRSNILCYLRSHKDAHNISIKSMSLQTRIHPTDIVNELMRNNLLVMKDGNYFIKTWKLAFKFPLAMLRRRVVDSSRIRWTPHFDVTTLDPLKLNHYA